MKTDGTRWTHSSRVKTWNPDHRHWKQVAVAAMDQTLSHSTTPADHNLLTNILSTYYYF